MTKARRSTGRHALATTPSSREPQRSSTTFARATTSPLATFTR